MTNQQKQTLLWCYRLNFQDGSNQEMVLLLNKQSAEWLMATALTVYQRSGVQATSVSIICIGEPG